MNRKLFSLAILSFALGIFAVKVQAQASGTNPQLYMYRHNGSLDNTPAPILPGNTIGTLEWRGLTATNAIRLGATIRSTALQVSPGFMTANMVFSTSGAAGLKERAIITESGLVGIGTMTPVFHLDVVGNTHTSGRFFGRIHFDAGEPTDLPSTYIDEAYFERKSRLQLGLGANTYANGGILSLAPGAGSLDRQLFSGGDDGLWTRSQDLAGGNTWAAWEKILTSGDINGRPNLVARFLPPGPSSSKLSDGQVFDNGANVVIGGIPAAPAVPAPVFNPADMLTVKGNVRTEGNFHATGDASFDSNVAVTGNTSSGALQVLGNATIGGNASANTLQVSNNSTLNGNVGIGKAPTSFDLDVAGQANFDGRVKVGAANFPGTGNYELAVGGGVIAEEVLVQLEGSWPDYVFDQRYALQPLSEVERYISQEKHLPGVVSGTEVADRGLNLGQMQKAQMEKIEELYLHVIEMNKQLTTLQAENAALKAQFAELEKRN